MAHVLDKSKITLRQMLGRYHSLVLGVAILMSLGAISFCVTSTLSYSQAMEQVLSLNEYYGVSEGDQGRIHHPGGLRDSH